MLVLFVLKLLFYVCFMIRETIGIWDAIHEMRKLTSKGISFSFVHNTFNLQNRTTEGIRRVENGILRPAAKEDGIEHADEKLFYIDKDKDVQRNCWQILLMYFNEMKVEV